MAAICSSPLFSHSIDLDWAPNKNQAKKRTVSCGRWTSKRSVNFILGIWREFWATYSLRGRDGTTNGVDSSPHWCEGWKQHRKSSAVVSGKPGFESHSHQWPAGWPTFPQVPLAPTHQCLIQGRHSIKDPYCCWVGKGIWGQKQTGEFCPEAPLLATSVLGEGGSS